MIQILVKDKADSTQTIIIDGASYEVNLQWNGRDESWRMALGRSGTGFVTRFKITNGVDLLKPYRAYEGTPDGYLYCVDAEKFYGRVDKEGLINERFLLLYLTEEEYLSIKEG